MTENNIQLEDRLVGSIKGDFYVPSYQRGYRWDESQVKQLLNDIMDNGDKAYCLQPLVVRRKGDGVFELIDGQQRLTTIYILMKYIKDNYKPRLKIDYSLSYETRVDSADFLNNINENRANENIDYWFIYNAYRTIDEWFKKKEETGNDQQAADLFALYFFPKVGNGMGGNVKFIWYEVQGVEDKDAIALFTRLNIGRIPLTNAELVKALFLRKQDKEESKLEEKRQLEISLQWDTIEHELHDDDFWYFLTREDAGNYPTRVELLFDFISADRENKKDPLSVFLHFNKIKEEQKDLSEFWEDIVTYYYRLKEWYKKKNYYHKIGYLVASGSKTMGEIVTATAGMRKKNMDEWLDEEIKKSVAFKKAYADLNYKYDYDEISRLLLLFNVISIMDCSNDTRFPFKVYSKKEWSLEHIHPQHPEEMKNDQELWRDWVKAQEPLVKEFIPTDEEKRNKKREILEAIEVFKSKMAITVGDFRSLSSDIVGLLSDTAEDLTHSLSNMALLSKEQNSALNNSLFGAKRTKIIAMDKKGEYIPYCTRNVFLKYYTDGNKVEQMQIWGDKDRKCYIKAMNELLYNKDKHEYLAEEITA